MMHPTIRVLAYTFRVRAETGPAKVEYYYALLPRIANDNLFLAKSSDRKELWGQLEIR
ncbi:hypothetical protein J2X42_000215 [Arthrobacter sp. BE255]|nr:hypothetical protein [Arthrobacter sp. BE255]